MSSSIACYHDTFRDSVADLDVAFSAEQLAEQT